MRLAKHFLFWAGVMIGLTLLFGQKGRDYIQAFYFVTMLIPVAVGTTYFFNSYLLPQYLLKQKYLRFGLYFLYTVVVSVYLEMVVATIAFVVLANYQWANMNPLTVDVFMLGTVLYLIVFATAFWKIFQRYSKMEVEMKQVRQESEVNKLETLQIRADRKNVPVLLDELKYVESLSDYVKVVTAAQTYITREKISHLEKQLPSHFIRIHRSYLVNSHQITSFNRETITIGEQELPVSRTYKKKVMEYMAESCL